MVGGAEEGEMTEEELKAIEAALAANAESWITSHQRFMFVIDSDKMRVLVARLRALEVSIASALTSLRSIGRDGETYSDSPGDHIADAQRALEAAEKEGL